MEITPLESNYFMVLCLRLICLDLLLNMLFLALACAISQCMQIAVTGLCHLGMSSKRFFNHYASSIALSRTLNSNSIVERGIHVCLVDFQETSSLPNVKTCPLVDLDVVLSKIQFASLYSSRAGE